jgi:hypothetical protein
VFRVLVSSSHNHPTLVHQIDARPESTNLSKLTKVLIWLTVAIGAFAIVQIVIMVFEYFKNK